MNKVSNLKWTRTPLKINSIFNSNRVCGALQYNLSAETRYPWQFQDRYLHAWRYTPVQFITDNKKGFFPSLFPLTTFIFSFWSLKRPFTLKVPFYLLICIKTLLTTRASAKPPQTNCWLQGRIYYLDCLSLAPSLNIPSATCFKRTEKVQPGTQLLMR